MKPYKLSQARIHQYLKEWFNHKSRKNGSAVLLLVVLLMFSVMIPIVLSTVQNVMYIETKKAIERRIVVSALAGLSNVNQDSMAYGDTDLNAADAENTFKEYLRKNMDLDSNYVPMKTSDYDQIIIKELKVYTATELPTQCSYNTPINLPSIHVVIETNVDRKIFKSMFGDKIHMVIHKDVDLYTNY